MLLQQKLKLSITPYGLDEMTKIPYYERGGRDRHPVIAVTSSSMFASEKPIGQTNF